MIRALLDRTRWRAPFSACRRRPNQPQTFRAAVQGVSVPVSVQDGRRGVSGLRADDFTLTDNGVPQRITAVSVEANPIDVTLVLDTSSSITAPMLQRFRAEVDAVTGFPGSRRSRRVDHLFIVGARNRRRCTREAKRSTTLPLAPAGATAFYHAVVAALLTRATPGRPHLALILSDGDDNVSFLDGTDLSDLARRSETVLHVVLRGAIKARGSRVGWLAFHGPRAARCAGVGRGGDRRRGPARKDRRAGRRIVQAGHRRLQGQLRPALYA